MATNQTEQSFYGELDRFRYKTNWGCLGWVLLLLAVIALTIWWLWAKR